MIVLVRQIKLTDPRRVSDIGDGCVGLNESNECSFATMDKTDDILTYGMVNEGKADALIITDEADSTGITLTGATAKVTAKTDNLGHPGLYSTRALLMSFPSLSMPLCCSLTGLDLYA